MRSLPIFFSLLCVLLSPRLGAAYAIEIHDALPDVLSGLPGAGESATLPGDDGLERFRARFYRRAATVTDTTLRERFLKRYPTEKEFSLQAFKEFFGMAATHPALGFDRYQDVWAKVEKRGSYGEIGPGEALTLQEWTRIGSIYPDLDRRNRGRWLVHNGEIERSPADEPIPFDPAILNMGKVEALSGQAHAHYGLNNNPKSDSAGVLRERPADFAVRIGFPEVPVLTFAPERAQAYGDLAIVARAEGEEALAALYAGNAFHYLGDLGNQIHTIQVGIFDFFVDATLQSWKTKVKCLWGLLCEPMERNSIGIDIIGNHHTWSEEIFRIAFQRARAGEPIHPEMGPDSVKFDADPAFMAQWATMPAEGPLLQALAERMILDGNREGPEIYKLSRALTVGELRKAGVKYDFEHQPDSVVLSKLAIDLNDKRLARFFSLERRGTARAASAMAHWWERVFRQPPDADAAMTRLLRMQLDELDAAEDRRALWISLGRKLP